MDTNRFGEREQRIALVLGIFCLLGMQTAFGQQFVSGDAAEHAECFEAVRANALGSGSCGHAAVEELARSGHAFAENQLGIESALVLGPQRTIRDARSGSKGGATRIRVGAR